ncbi:uncharacterized protein LOC116616860 [Nematostella vectensis]|uniref:uncharacterized protein LOC116616860 n=1 Tax=Nematostella vectensis TaxID=45351 RepID=UPI00139066D8|nr:uncharacterized protein LOC116616860 [Nematostella vectensis]
MKKKKKTMTQKTIDRLLRPIYYDPNHPAALGGVDKLVRAVRYKGVRRAQVNSWLRSQPTYTLHEPYRRRYPRKRVVVNGMDEQWQADLCDMQALRSYNEGYNYLLTVIDVLKKYAWVVLLKDKTGKRLVEAFESIFKGGRQPEKLQTNDGTEFKNRIFSTRSELEASVVERFNRTLKTWMWRWFTNKETCRYVDMLPQLVHNYNHSYHRSIRRAPADVVTYDDAQEVWAILYGKKRPGDPKKKRAPPKFNVGDRVRISKIKHVFAKGYIPNWTEEVFTVGQRYNNTNQKNYAYRLREYDGTWLEGRFYEPELQHVSLDEQRDLFRIERVIRTRGKGRNEEYFVQWRGWPDKYNSWVSAQQVHKIS